MTTLDRVQELTPTDLFAHATSQEFLKDCLDAADLGDLGLDIADACDINELNAVSLSCLSSQEVADKLFLMQEEAARLLEHIKNHCLGAGVNFGDGSIVKESAGVAKVVVTSSHKSPRTSANDPSTAAALAAVQVKDKVSNPTAPHKDPVTANTEHASVAKEAPAISSNGTKRNDQVQLNGSSVTADAKTKPATGAVAAKPASRGQSIAKAGPAAAAGISEPVEPATKPGAASRLPVGATPSPVSAAPKATPRPQSARMTPKQAAVPPTKSTATPAPNTKPTTTPTHTKPATTPSSIPKTVTSQLLAPTASPPVQISQKVAPPTKATPPPRATPRQLSAGSHNHSSTPQSSVPRPQSATPRSDYIPSYARPTASSKATKGTDEPEAASGADSHERPQRTPDLSPVKTSRGRIPVLQDGGASPRAPAMSDPSQQDPKAPIARKPPVFANIRASLLKPTKAFLAWASGRKEERDARATPDVRGTRQGGSSRPSTTDTSGAKSRPRPKSAHPLSVSMTLPSSKANQPLRRSTVSTVVKAVDSTTQTVEVTATSSQTVETSVIP